MFSADLSPGGPAMNSSISRIDRKNLSQACTLLARADDDLAKVLGLYGTPPLWSRPGGFPTLLRIILEQQVSLASARACFDKLTLLVADVTPAAVLELSDVDLRMVGFSRQKTEYARQLARAVIEDTLPLAALGRMSDEEARRMLLKVKGIGAWTSDIYLLMALRRPDIMPRGDIALHAAYQKLSGSGVRPQSDEFLAIAEKWKPLRSVAARLLWHFYLSEKRKPVQ